MAYISNLQNRLIQKYGFEKHKVLMFWLAAKMGFMLYIYIAVMFTINDNYVISYPMFIWFCLKGISNWMYLWITFHEIQYVYYIQQAMFHSPILKFTKWSKIMYGHKTKISHRNITYLITKNKKQFTFDERAFHFHNIPQVNFLRNNLLHV